MEQIKNTALSNCSSSLTSMPLCGGVFSFAIVSILKKKRTKK